MTGITALPTPPQRSDPGNFPTRGDTFMAALPLFATEANALAADVTAKQGLAATSASNAATSETNAAASAASAAATSGVVAWVSGTTYSPGNNVYSLINYKTYRRITSGAGTTDPSSDPTNWSLISVGAGFFMHVQEQYASGTSGGQASSGTRNVPLNTVVYNNITGASLSSGLITLPTGTYDIIGSVVSYSTNAMKGSLYNNTDSTTTLIGTSAFDTSGQPQSSNVYSHIKGRVIITATKAFYLKQFIQTGGSGTYFGFASSSGLTEVFGDIMIWKAA
jgi:hypothetical protein